MNFFNKIFFINDFNGLQEDEAQTKIQVNSQFSSSYLFLLIVSSVIATLGLLLNSSPVIIGGMVISPLMWPLLKISYGISKGRKSYLEEGLWIVFLSIIISFLASAFIAYISPLKITNPEITSRTNPTVLDVIIAIAAGSVAVLGASQSKISESIAGVAIATALIPPLSVSAIGLVLVNWEVILGGFMLFLANVISIIFVSVLIFSFLVKPTKEKSKKFQKKGILVVSIILILLSVPLFFLLQDFTFQNTVFANTRRTLIAELSEISSQIELQSLETNLEGLPGNQKVLVQASLQMPDSVILNYQQQRRLRESLVENLGRPVDLRISLLRVLSVLSEEDLQKEKEANLIREILDKEIKEISSDLSIQNLNLKFLEQTKESKEMWSVEMFLNSGENLTFSDLEVENLVQKIEKKVQKKIDLRVKITPLLKIRSKPDLELDKEKREIENSIRREFNGLAKIQGEFLEITILNLNLDPRTDNEETKLQVESLNQTGTQVFIESRKIRTLEVFIELKTSPDFKIVDGFIDSLKQFLRQNFQDVSPNFEINRILVERL